MTRLTFEQLDEYLWSIRDREGGYGGQVERHKAIRNHDLALRAELERLTKENELQKSYFASEQELTAGLRGEISKLQEERDYAKAICLDQRQQLSRLSLHWSTERPTVPGWYWYRDAYYGPAPVHVAWHGFVDDPDNRALGIDIACGDECDQPLGDLAETAGEWSGPIPLPKPEAD